MLRHILLMFSLLILAPAPTSANQAATPSGDLTLIKAWWIGSKNEFQLQLENRQERTGMVVNFVNDMEKPEVELFMYSLDDPKAPSVNTTVNLELLRPELLAAVRNRKLVELTLYPVRERVPTETVPSVGTPYTGYVANTEGNVPREPRVTTGEVYFGMLERRLVSASSAGVDCVGLVAK